MLHHSSQACNCYLRKSKTKPLTKPLTLPNHHRVITAAEVSRTRFKIIPVLPSSHGNRRTDGRANKTDALSKSMNHKSPLRNSRTTDKQDEWIINHPHTKGTRCSRMHTWVMPELSVWFRWILLCSSTWTTVVSPIVVLMVEKNMSRTMPWPHHTTHRVMSSFQFGNITLAHLVHQSRIRAASEHQSTALSSPFFPPLFSPPFLVPSHSFFLLRFLWLWWWL